MGEEEKTEHQQKLEAAKEEIRKLEDDPPQRLEDWPEGQAKYETFGGPDGEHSYNEGPETKLGPDSVRYREDGSVEVGRSTTPGSSRANRFPAARPTPKPWTTPTSSGSPRTRTRTDRARTTQTRTATRAS